MASTESGSKPTLGSVVCDWAKLPVVPTAVGERREFFDAPTATLRNFECHATTLNPGEAPHAPHRHPDEEMIVVKEGAVEVMINGHSQTAGAGSVFFFASGDFHGLRNAGPTRATYHVFRFITGAAPAVEQRAGQ
jgi:XRE family transcriptional regulator, regulator of sulfur utilization